MNSLESLSGSGERLSFFKLFSEKDFKVEIPIIQRDYAQGRDSEQEVRASFLHALYEYLKEGKPHRDLDFVYGSIIEEAGLCRFVPLDGQQRLTTLFLLHWYLGQISDKSDCLRSVLCKDGKAKFSYETRASSSEFCDALMANNIDMSNLLKSKVGHDSLSKTIQDQGWFYLSWWNDPTIQSMLTMLDSIHSKFSGCVGYFDKLVDADQPVITFLFLNLQEFNLTDDLYIKMNARGKLLTDFENFKARLEQKVKSFRGEWPRYELSFRGTPRPVNGYEYFIHKIDTDWADVFWVYRNEFTKDDTFDDELMSCIALIVANFHLLQKSKDAGALKADRSKLFGDGGQLNRLSFFEYEELGCFSKGLVEHLIEIMDLIHNGEVRLDGIKPYLDCDDYYSEDELFKKAISNNTTYPEKLRFYAFYSYLANGKDKAGLLEWLRVVFNLTENTIINTAEEYSKALVSIDELSQKDQSILALLKKDCDVSGFAGAQVLEEKVKAQLITKSTDWEEVVIRAEQHLFFRGQIGFLLSFSGVLEFYWKDKNCDWPEDQNDTYFAKFNKYANAAAEVFFLIKDSSANIDYLWERAVLSKGEYFTKSSADRWNLLSTRWGKNNIERDHSWRRLLRLSVSGEPEWERRQGYVKAVFDDLRFDVNDINTSLGTICLKALDDPAIENWHKKFIKYDELYDVCNQGFIAISNGEIILLSESQRNHYHSELHTKVLEFELIKIPDQLPPFNGDIYWPVKTRYESAGVVIKGKYFDNKHYSIKVCFSSDTFNIKFKGGDPSNFPEVLITVLTNQGFKLKETGFEDSGIHGCFTLGELSEIQPVIDKIVSLCSDLKDLTNE